MMAEEMPRLTDEDLEGWRLYNDSSKERREHYENINFDTSLIYGGDGGK
jgi:hypothetical protein